MRRHCRHKQCGPQIFVAPLDDVTLTSCRSTRVALTRDESSERGQFWCLVEAGDVSHFREEDGRRCVANAGDRLQ